MLNKDVVILLFLVMVAVMVSGCIFGTTPLDKVSTHLIQATDALEELDLIEGRTNTYILDEELWMIDQIFFEMEEILPEDEKNYARLQAYRVWTEALGSASAIMKGEYDTYKRHLGKAVQYYDQFNYVEWKKEITLAESQVDKMANKAQSAAYQLDGVSREDLTDKELIALQRTRSSMMDISRQCMALRSNLREENQDRL